MIYKNSISWINASLNARMAVNNGVLAVCEYNISKIALFSLSDGSKPRFIARFNTGNAPRHVELVGNLCYIACENDGKIYVYDITAPNNVSLVKTITTKADIKMFRIIDNHIYTACFDTAYLQKIDLNGNIIKETNPVYNIISIDSNKANMIAITSLHDGYVHLYNNSLDYKGSINVGGNNPTCTWINQVELAVADSTNNKIHIIDLASMSIIKSVDVSVAPEQVICINDKLYISSLQSQSSVIDEVAKVNDVWTLTQTLPCTSTGGFLASYKNFVYANGHFPPYVLDVIEI